MHPIERSLLAVAALAAGDLELAQHHVALADRDCRDQARRDRQLIEILALVVSGDATRAADLAREHTHTFPADSTLLGVLTRGRPDQRRSP